jgi:hypothetical protein
MAEAEVVAVVHRRSQNLVVNQEILRGLGPHSGPWAQIQGIDVYHSAQYVGNHQVGERRGFDLTVPASCAYSRNSSGVSCASARATLIATD